MTFAAAICGRPKSGPPRFALLLIEAASLDHAIVEAHRIAFRDHSFSGGFVGHEILVRPIHDRPDAANSPIAYRYVHKKSDVEFNPDRSPRD